MAGRIPQSFIDELLTRVDIVDIVDARVPLKKAGKDYKACCPFHEEKTPSFTVSPDKQFYHCFGCGEHGTAIGFLMQYDRMSFPEAVRDLAAGAGMPVPEAAGSEGTPARQTTDLLDLLNQADRYFRHQLREHPGARVVVDYLKGRGLSGEIAADFGLGYAPPGWDNLLNVLGKDEAAREALCTAGLVIKKDAGGYYDRFRDRVMFPIHDYRGRIVGFGGRVLGAGEPKYLNSPETPVFHKGREVYGLFRAREAIRREQRVLLVEGYMDVAALAQFGIDYACATLGTAATRDHLERLFRFAPEVVFAFDGDRAGREAAWRAMENVLPVLHAGHQVSFLFMPEGEDPDSLVRKEGHEAFAARIRQARPLPEYMIETLVERVDLNRLDGRARLVELARPLVVKLPEGLFREMIVDRLGEISSVNGEKLSTLLGISQQTAFTKHRRTAAANRGPKPPQKPMRRAVSLLVQHPELAQEVGDRQAFEWDLPGAQLFQELLALLAERPHLNTAALVEHFRGTEAHRHLEKLAALKDPIDVRDVKTEFLDTLERLHTMGIASRVETLMSKERLRGLTPSEKQELGQLLMAKNAPGSGTADG